MDSNYKNLIEESSVESHENQVVLSNAIEAAHDAIFILEGNSKVCFWNSAAEQLFGYSKKDILGKELQRLVESEEHDTALRECLKEAQLKGQGDVTEKIVEIEARDRDGRKFEMELSASTFHCDNTWYSVSIVRDISQRKQEKREIENSLQQYLELAEEAPIGIISCDNDGKIIYVNHKVLDILGSKSIMETKMINLLTFPLLVKHGFSEKLQECLHDNKFDIYEINYESKWGKKVWIRTHIKPLVNTNKVVGAQIIIDDISEKKQLEGELLLLSITDNLTKAYNRHYFIQNLEKEIERANRTGSRFSVIMMDIDHFKHINDCFGHNIGDLVLKTITAELIKRIRKMDTLARWGGEEFIILLPETTKDNAIFLAEKLRNILIMTKIAEVGNVTASFGVACYHIGDTADKIVQNADDMMYEAKSAGRNCIRFIQE